MLTIGQLADYVGVTRRAIRHYHALGLLPEPERTASGYRSYHAQHVVELHRIKVLTDAGVPLSRVRGLVDAEQEAFREAAAQIDAELRARIAELEATRESLDRLAVRGEPFLPPQVTRMQQQMRALGVSERTLQMERDAWLLIQVLFPTWSATGSTPSRRCSTTRSTETSTCVPTRHSTTRRTIRGSKRSPKPLWNG